MSKAFYLFIINRKQHWIRLVKCVVISAIINFANLQNGIASFTHTKRYSFQAQSCIVLKS